MATCTDLQNWGSFTRDGRRAALEQLINDKLQSEGYDPVNVTLDNLPTNVAETSPPDDNGKITITLDNDYLDQANAQDAVDTAVHEADHVKQWQDEDEQEAADPLVWKTDEDKADAAGTVGGIQWGEECQPPDPNEPDLVAIPPASDTETYQPEPQASSDSAGADAICEPDPEPSSDSESAADECQPDPVCVDDGDGE